MHHPTTHLVHLLVCVAVECVDVFIEADAYDVFLEYMIVFIVFNLYLFSVLLTATGTEDEN